MKKLIQIAATAVAGAALMAGVAAADTTKATCDIYNTGSASHSSCTNNSENSAQVVCDNKIYVLNQNSQNAGTGGAVVSENGEGGSAVSGSATNENGQKVTIGASCVATTASTTPTTPPAGGQGSGEAAPTPQVTSTPTGAVHAGGGAGALAVSGWQIAGLVVSLGVIVAGAALRFRGLAR